MKLAHRLPGFMAQAAGARLAKRMAHARVVGDIEAAHIAIRRYRRWFGRGSTFMAAAMMAEIGLGGVVGVVRPNDYLRLGFLTMGANGEVGEVQPGQVPEGVRVLGQFSTAVLSDDYDTAWALWLAAPSRVASFILFQLADQALAAQVGEEEEP